MSGPKPRPALDRFAGKIALTESGCIEWLGSQNGSGYGQFYFGKKLDGSSGMGYAHRWSFEYHIGPISPGLQLDHLCRNRACVNPIHLEAVTQRENLLRGESPSAINARVTHCPAGHPYAGDNLSREKGGRKCRACKRLIESKRVRRAA